jgi:hypothetical protein
MKVQDELGQLQLARPGAVRTLRIRHDTATRKMALHADGYA